MRPAAPLSCLLVLSVTLGSPAPAAHDAPVAHASAALHRPAAQVVSIAAGGLPIAFEPNRGQAPRQATFAARVGGGHVLFMPDAIVFVTPARTEAFSRPARQMAVLRMELVGARDVAPVGREALPGVSTYASGSQPDRWIGGVPHFGSVIYRDVYDGIDLVFRGADGVLAYDFIVAAGADPSTIRWRMVGARTVSVDEQGALSVSWAGPHQVHGAPSMFQGSDKVPGGFRIDAKGAEIGFRVDEFDPDRVLVIDPAIGFSTLLGGAASEDLPRIDLDDAGNAYVVGTTASIDFPTVRANESAGVAAFAGDVDIFVTKVDTGTSRLVYATFLGGAGTDRAGGVAVAADGGVWVTGWTTSGDFPAAGGWQDTLAGGSDAFVAKLAADGTVEQASLLGGGGVDTATGIAVDGSGNVHLTGNTGSSDFPVADALQDHLGAPSDAFVAGFDSTATRLLYSTFLGAPSANDAGFGIAVGPAGGVYVTGSTESADFPRVGAAQPAFGGNGDAFVIRLDTTTARLSWATTLGGREVDAGLAIAVDAFGSAYVTGQTRSADFPTRNALQSRAGGDADAFVVKISADGAAVEYATFLGGAGLDVGGGIAVDGAGNAHVTGMTASPDFPTKDSLQQFMGGGSDAFVSRLTDRGTAFAYSTLFGGAGAEAGIDIVVDGAGNAYVVGQTGSPDFPTYNAIQGALQGPQDVFVSKICLALVFPTEGSFASSAAAGSVAVTTPAGCAWLAHSDVDWIRLTSPNAVAGSGDVSFDVTANPTGRARSGTLTIGGAVFTATQQPAAACELDISPASDNFYSAGGVGRIDVRTTDDCSWTAASNVNWVAITSGSKGTGPGVVSYTVEQNNSGRQRSGTMTVAGQTFVVFDWIRRVDSEQE